MKKCSYCENELVDEALFCPKCGNEVGKENNDEIENNKEENIENNCCSNRGKEFSEADNFCKYCGNPKMENVEYLLYNLQTKTTEHNYKNQTIDSNHSNNNGAKIAINVFMILSCVIPFLLIGTNLQNEIELYFGMLSLGWVFPMTMYTFICFKNNQKLSIVFKICTLLFVNTIAGIIMLSNNDL